MSDSLNDPIGQAILDYNESKKSVDIIVESDICDDDIIPSEYFFRSFNEMPKIEQEALKRCTGKTLDIGAAAGTHAKYLKKNGIDVTCIEISSKSVDFLKSQKITAERINFFDIEGQEYNTLLMLMNGIGIAGKLSNLEYTLIKAKSLLVSGGKLLCDSSDLKFLYEDDKGAMWVDLNTAYYGDFKFNMTYKEHSSGWFDWLYVDFKNFEKIALKVGFSVEKIIDIDDQYLVELIKK